MYNLLCGERVGARQFSSMFGMSRDLISLENFLQILTRKVFGVSCQRIYRHIHRGLSCMIRFEEFVLEGFI